ncbi:uncharacterized protein LOC131943897 [Physella acuta]|uniref:uncharacterized protein LOC131943897 n=1 Tax=Physella acuta TaxID=109671 RepID=UPI0027DACC65|nr:uncharacterized protein LOC131943897 [Physella acuta]
MSSENKEQKYSTGIHEVYEEHNENEEINLQNDQKNCAKNPGHTSLVPINELTAEHFPVGYQDEDLLVLTKGIADLTVRIHVGSTKTTGTGIVGQIKKFDEGDKCRNTCPCPACVTSATPNKVWWRVHVLTATHLVFDTKTASSSSCRLWFDEEGSKLFIILGWKLGGSHTKGDVSELYCATHDSEIGDKLEEMLRQVKILYQTVTDKYKSVRDKDKLTIIVSHPHGCSKQVSVGSWVHRDVFNHEMGTQTRYFYDTCTCQGSSGASVYRLGYDWPAHPHSGVNNSGLNYSASGVWDLHM